jgi:hypothetical protein
MVQAKMADMWQKVQVTRQEALEFRDRFNMLPPQVTERITCIFWAELLLLSRMGFIPEQILEVIHDLESNARKARTKPQTPFEDEPLRGLWHKHYTGARFMPKIIQNGLGGPKLRNFQKILEEELKTDGDRDEKIERIRDRSLEPYVKKSKTGQLTGEWIVYLPYRGNNYYLCLGTHNDIQSIYNKVTLACPVEPGFEQILKWWEEVRTEN